MCYPEMGGKSDSCTFELQELQSLYLHMHTYGYSLNISLKGSYSHHEMIPEVR